MEEEGYYVGGGESEMAERAERVDVLHKIGDVHITFLYVMTFVPIYTRRIAEGASVVSMRR